MFKKISVPLDGSELAAKILPRVKELAKACDAEITLITVGHYATDEEVGEATPRLIFEAGAEENRVGQRYLQQTAAALRSAGMKTTWVYMRGVPAQTIIAYAGAKEMDLIAMASRKRAGLGARQRGRKGRQPRNYTGAATESRGTQNADARAKMGQGSITPGVAPFPVTREPTGSRLWVARS